MQCRLVEDYRPNRYPLLQNSLRAPSRLTDALCPATLIVCLETPKSIMKTYSAKPGEIEQKWFVVDADGLVLGRMASEIAKILRGKNKPVFTAHTDTGDNVIVINASRVRLTGRKAEQKEYFTHSGYMGNDKKIPFAKMLARRPERVVERAIYGMLPKSTLGTQRLRRKLRVYPGAEHPHGAQQPTLLNLSKSESK